MLQVESRYNLTMRHHHPYGKIKYALDKLNRRGASLPEVMIAVGILGVGMMGILNFGRIWTQESRDVLLKSRLSLIRNQLESTIGSQPAWEKTIANNSGAGGSMTCLATKTCTNGQPATESAQLFKLYDSDGSLVYDPTDASAGYTLNGMRCADVGLTGSNCPVKVKLRWQAECDTANPLSCKFPTENIWIEYTINVPGVVLNQKRFSIVKTSRKSLAVDSPFSRCLRNSVGNAKFFVGREHPSYRGFDVDDDGCVPLAALRGETGAPGPAGKPGLTGPDGVDGPRGEIKHTYYISYYNTPTPAPTPTP